MNWYDGALIAVILLLAIVAATYYAAWRIQMQHNASLMREVDYLTERVQQLDDTLTLYYWKDKMQA